MCKPDTTPILGSKYPFPHPTLETKQVVQGPHSIEPWEVRDPALFHPHFVDGTGKVQKDYMTSKVTQLSWDLSLATWV